jgi:hypothetical protein
MDIVKQLKDKYIDYQIKWCLIGCRYIDNKHIPNKLKHKYKLIEKNLFGVNDYFNLLNIKISFSNYSYCKFLNKIADTMFE